MSTEIGIPAIHDDDLKKIIEKYGLSNELKEGKLKCIACKGEISWENIYAFAIKDEMPVFYCDSIDCIEFVNNSAFHHG